MNDGIIGTACVGIAHHGFRLRRPHGQHGHGSAKFFTERNCGFECKKIIWIRPCIAGHPLHGAGLVYKGDDGSVTV